LAPPVALFVVGVLSAQAARSMTPATRLKNRRFILYSPRKYLGLVCAILVGRRSPRAPRPYRRFGKRTPAAVSESGGTILLVNQGIKGDHAGSDASCGVITSRSLYPVKSIEYSRGPPPLPCLSVGIWRKYMSTRPLGAQVGPSTRNAWVSRRSPEPSGRMTPI